jgi:hypothetical protein
MYGRSNANDSGSVAASDSACVTPAAKAAPLDLTFVVTPSNPKVYASSFAASPLFAQLPADRLILQEGFPAASLAYNDAIDKAKTDLIVFAHQDVLFPEGWLADLRRALDSLAISDPDWAVLGGYGVTRTGQRWGCLYSVGLGIVGTPFKEPVEVGSLDEYFLILRKSSGLRFDPKLPNFHFYGTDICQTALAKGKKSYAISAFAVHNTSYGTGPVGFFEGYRYMREKWAGSLPIFTPCIGITRFNKDVHIHNVKQAYLKFLGRKEVVVPRLDDPSSVLTSIPINAENTPST